jgi:adenosine/AMP kinase
VGVIDGFLPKGVEGDDHIAARKGLLRDIIGYKR